MGDSRQGKQGFFTASFFRAEMISVFGNENRLRPLMKQPCEKADFRLKIKNSYDTIV